MPQLVLSRSDHAVTVKYADAPVEGYPVVIAKRYIVLFCCLSCAFNPYCMTEALKCCVTSVDNVHQFEILNELHCASWMELKSQTLYFLLLYPIFNMGQM